MHFFEVFLKKAAKTFGGLNKIPYLCTRFKELSITTTKVMTKAIGRLAQLVQSICLTSRGSGVRIPQRPQGCFLVVFSSERLRGFFCLYTFYFPSIHRHLIYFLQICTLKGAHFIKYALSKVHILFEYALLKVHIAHISQ